MIKIHWRRPVAAAAMALAALTVATPAADAAKSKRKTRVAVAASSDSGRGVIDADVRSAGGKRLGFLQGDLRKDGRGLLTFRAAAGVKRADEVLSARGKDLAGDASKVTAGSHDFKLSVTVGGDGRLSGTGRLNGKKVTLTGVGRERRGGLDKGKKLLVVGHPRGVAYDALASYYRPVDYDASRHTRERFLDDRRAFDEYAGVVFGADVKPNDLKTHPLVRAFYGAGRWVIVAPATKPALDVIKTLHPAAVSGERPAVAVRSVGPEGSSARVRTTVPFAETPRSDARVLKQHPDVAKRAARAQEQWFLGEIARLSVPHMNSARDTDPKVKASRKQTRGRSLKGVSFSLPYNAAAIEVHVAYNYPWTLTGANNLSQFQPCGWNQKDWNTWCPDTWYWQQQSGGNTYTGCEWFLEDTQTGPYYIVDADVVRSVSSHSGSDPYKFKWNSWDTAALVLQRKAGDQCPQEYVQSGNFQGNDYYYVLYDNETDEHTLIALSDPTISASDAGDGSLAIEGTNGRGRDYYADLECDDGCWYEYPWKGIFFGENAWFLGAYKDKLTLSGPNVDGSTFEYSNSNSYPTTTITQESQSTGSSHSTSYQVGVIGDQGQYSYGSSQSSDYSVTIDVPDWSVTPVSGEQTVTYNWTTNTPVAWADIAAGKSGPYSSSPGAGNALNPLNRTGFGAASLTAWSGNSTWGALNVAVDREISLVDHYSVWSNGGVKEGYAIQTRSYSDSPNGVTPVTSNPVGAGLNLCDPMVAAPRFKSQCASGN